jgi:hypothetical protein
LIIHVFSNRLSEIYTERGQKALDLEKDAIQIFEDAYPACKFLTTNKAETSLIDGFISMKGRVVSAVETKTRNVMLDQLRAPASSGGFDNEWMVGYEKISNARELCVALRVILTGWLYLPSEKSLLVQKICDERGNFLTKVRVQTTKTRDPSKSGGSKVGSNAFINIEQAVVLK